MIKTVFKRYEMKYLLTESQMTAVMNAVNERMREDEYGNSTIRNVYFDTDTFLLIRRSIEKPVYKEKLRTRSYSRSDDGSKVFLELKKKYDGVVYKRRVLLTEKEVSEWTSDHKTPDLAHDGTFNEMDYFMGRYQGLSPKMFISYDRRAFFSSNDEDLRITFDRNVLWRTEDLSLSSEIYGNSALPDGMTLMEIKTSKGLPMWLVSILSKNRIYKSSFSKYGTSYKQMIAMTQTMNKEQNGQGYSLYARQSIGDKYRTSEVNP